MGRIPQDVIDRVLAAHDIVEVVGRSIALKKMGRTWKALCPFHEEKTPSFTVNPERQTFKCFGCQKGGNVFGWLMEREGVSFPEAVRALAAERGIPVPSTGGAEGPDRSRLEAIRAALATAQDLYVRTLWGPDGGEARAYLEKRGFPPAASKAFGLGLSPASWDGLISTARSRGIDGTVLEEAGLAIRREKKEGWYDRFRARLMFPIADVSGRLVTYGARALRPEDQPKYLNGPETPVFRKGRTLFALDRAKDGIRKAGHALLMEGYTDVLMAHMHGFTCAVAGMGTAFTPEQARALGGFTSRVVLVYDGDAAGRLAAEKSLDLLLEQGLEVRIALLPEGKDVDEVLLEEGVERLDGVVRDAKDVFDFKLEQMSKTLDLASPRGRALAAERLGDSIRRVHHVIERDLLFRRVAERLDVPEALVRAQAGQSAAADRSRGAPPVPGALPRGVPGGTDPAALRAHDGRLEQTRLVAGALFRPEWARAIRSELHPDEIRDPGLATLYRRMLEMADGGSTPAPTALASLLADDPEAQSALAGLPEDLPFDEWIPDALRLRQATRGREARRQAVLRDLAVPPSSAQDVPPGAPPGAPQGA